MSSTLHILEWFGHGPTAKIGSANAREKRPPLKPPRERAQPPRRHASAGNRPAILRCHDGRKWCGVIAPRLVIAIEAAMGAARVREVTPIRFYEMPG
jgi:hypothetical protein